MPFPRRSSIQLQRALAEFAHKYRLPEEGCALLLRAPACSLFVKAGRNSCFGSIGKRTESLGPQVKSSGATRLDDTQLNSQPPGGPVVERLSPGANIRLLPVREEWSKWDAIPELAQNEWRGASIRQDSAHTTTVVLPMGT